MLRCARLLPRSARPLFACRPPSFNHSAASQPLIHNLRFYTPVAPKKSYLITNDEELERLVSIKEKHLKKRNNDMTPEELEMNRKLGAFYKLKLIGPIVRSLVALGFDSPTEIQQKVIPAAILRTNIIASAETGTGKTLAYALPMLQHIYVSQRSNSSDRSTEKKRTSKTNSKQRKARHENDQSEHTTDDSSSQRSKHKIKALIMTPTKELAEQVNRQINLFCQSADWLSTNEQPRDDSGNDAAPSTSQVVEPTSQSAPSEAELSDESVEINTNQQIPVDIFETDAELRSLFAAEDLQAIRQQEEKLNERDDVSVDTEAINQRTAKPSAFSVKTMVIVGNTSKKRQLDSITEQQPDVIIATPGRLLELLRTTTAEVLDLSAVRHFIIDECDKMLNMGFFPDLREIYQYLPRPNKTDPKANMQVIMVSATLTPGIEGLMQRFAPQHRLINLNEAMDVADPIKHIQYRVTNRKKFRLLLYLLKRKASLRDQQVLVFTRTKQRADRLAELLQQHGFKAESVHKDKTATTRSQTIESFKANEIQVLVATDVLARGIDVENLPFVVNFDIPSLPEEYVHRVGRTGRAGKPGTAISFVGVLPQVITLGHQTAELSELHFMKSIERFLDKRVELRKVPGPWNDPASLLLQASIRPSDLIDISRENKSGDEFETDEDALEAIARSKAAALEIIERKKEENKRLFRHKVQMIRNPKVKETFTEQHLRTQQRLSQTFEKIKSRLATSAIPTAASTVKGATKKAGSVPAVRKQLAVLANAKDVPSLRSFSEGRYEDMLTRFEERKARKRGVLETMKAIAARQKKAANKARKSK